MEGLFGGQLPEGIGRSFAEVSSKAKKWARRMVEDAEDLPSVADKIAMGACRAWMTPELKHFMDLKEPPNLAQMSSITEQWHTNQSSRHQVFVSRCAHPYSSGSSSGKKPVTCFHCGKVGHFAAECHLKASESPKDDRPRENPMIKCYKCGENGHKAPQCPQKKRGNVKRVKIPRGVITTLGGSDVMVKVNGSLVPVTIDSGAGVSLIPKEFIKESDYTGRKECFKGVLAKDGWVEADKAIATLHFGPFSFQEKVLAIPGEDMEWHGAYRHDLSDLSRCKQVADIMQ